uniref:RRM domain-containing protein n=1 Tax=Acrobeloides nanus TaxID=290746 RepID=A0A914E7L9_9BILA
MSGNCRVFLGRVSNRASEKDVERFFRDFKVREVVLKQGFGFVEFDNSREADDAVYEMNGKDLCGERVVVEMSNARRGGDRGGFRGGRGGFRGRGDFGGRGDYGGRGGFNGQRRFAAPVQTRYRLLVENLSTRCAWQGV